MLGSINVGLDWVRQCADSTVQPERDQILSVYRDYIYLSHKQPPNEKQLILVELYNMDTFFHLFLIKKQNGFYQLLQHETEMKFLWQVKGAERSTMT